MKMKQNQKTKMKNLPSVLPFSEGLQSEVATERVGEREKERVGEREKKRVGERER